MNWVKDYVDLSDVDLKELGLSKEYNLPSLATFPQIIIDGENIGGYSDLIEKYNSKEIRFD